MTSGPNHQWVDRLAQLVGHALDDFREQVQDRIDLFAVDCHPWNGVLNLALLTQAEVDRDPLLRDPAEMAAWKHFHFGSALTSWQPSAALALQKKEDYELAKHGRATIAEAYLRGCAVAMAREEVQQPLGRYSLTEGFRISVRHLDSDVEFYPPDEPG